MYGCIPSSSLTLAAVATAVAAVVAAVVAEVGAAAGVGRVPCLDSACPPFPR